ncbi:MAG: hypothetical protein Mars2KO_16600 [Maribacter sp.]
MDKFYKQISDYQPSVSLLQKKISKDLERLQKLGPMIQPSVAEMLKKVQKDQERWSHLNTLQPIAQQLIKAQEDMLMSTAPLTQVAKQLKGLYEPWNYIKPNFDSLNLLSSNLGYSDFVDFTRIPLSTEIIENIGKSLKVSAEELSILEYHMSSPEDTEYEEKDTLLIYNDTKEIITNIYNDNEILYTIDPNKFEEVIGELLYSKGFEVNISQKTRDGGYDILAITKQGGIPFKMLVECKRYKNTVGVGIVRSFCDVIETEKANKGILVTTSYFSKPAVERKSKKGGLLDLVNKDGIIDWIAEYHLGRKQ